jgi:hypothetical protein
VLTSVVAEGSNQSVGLAGNTGRVIIQGNQSTAVSVGVLVANGAYSTGGVMANVTVGNVANLSLSNGGDTRAENVTVTDTTISGTGLFGNNSAKIFYSEVAALNIIGGNGRQADQFTVIGSTSTSMFNSKITIMDNSSNTFRADVFVGPSSNLHLLLINDSSPQGTAQLFIHPSDVSVSISGTPNGVADLFTNGVLNSQLTFVGFGEVAD